MSSCVVLHTASARTCFMVESGLHLLDFQRGLGLDSEDTYTTCDGKLLGAGETTQNGKTYHIGLRLCGGKGGFGSMLRAIGAQIEKTTSREACRDLSGRRMRDVNNEKQLKEWIAKQEERDQEKEKRRQERLARRLAQPQHKFEDAEYHEQRNKVVSDLQDALHTGLQKRNPADAEAGIGAGQRKRKAEPSKTAVSKKKCEWLGIEMEELSSDEEEEPVCHRTSDAPATVTSEDSSSPRLQEEGQSSGSSTEDSCSSTPQAPCSSQDKDLSATAEEPVKPDVEEGEKSSSKGAPAEGATSLTGQRDSSRQHPLLAALKPPMAAQKVEDKATVTGPVNLEDFSAAVELEALGLDRLKAALMERGMKCGGTLQERAQRLYSVKGLRPEQIDSSLLAKASKGKWK